MSFDPIMKKGKSIYTVETFPAIKIPIPMHTLILTSLQPYSAPETKRKNAMTVLCYGFRESHSGMALHSGHSVAIEAAGAHANVWQVILAV